jgi:hypothetical protein
MTGVIPSEPSLPGLPKRQRLAARNADCNVGTVPNMAYENGAAYRKMNCLEALGQGNFLPPG